MVLMLGLGKDWILNVFDGCLALKKREREMRIKNLKIGNYTWVGKGNHALKPQNKLLGFY